jgi:O-antigen/teichoic acid export membrane protein
MALIIAHEEMDIYAYVSILEVILRLGIVYALSACPMDKLQLYGILMFTVTFINTSVYKIICRKKFPESRFHFYWNRDLFHEMTSYMGWNLFGASVGVFKNQLINILLNQFFNPVVNAARSIAFQVNAAVNSFAQHFSTATRPQLIKDYAADEKKAMLNLLYWASKGTFFLMYVFSLPLFFEMPYVLRLWLREPPEYTVLFTRLALIDALIDSISYPMMTAAQATGKIKLYQGVVGGILLCNFPVSLIALKLGAPAYSVMVIAIVITATAFIARIFILKLLLPFFCLHSFLKNVCIPVASVVLLAAVPVSLLVHFLPSSFMRFVVTVILSVGLVAVGIFKIGMSKDEQKQLIKKLKRKIGKN